VSIGFLDLCLDPLPSVVMIICWLDFHIIWPLLDEMLVYCDLIFVFWNLSLYSELSLIRCARIALAGRSSGIM